MSELIGIIVPLRKFLSNNNQKIEFEVNEKMTEILSLKENREYVIPDFQREIKWDKDNLSQLIEDIKLRPKYLGNIILTQNSAENKFMIIDGQQRITVLTMILTYLHKRYNGDIDLIFPCKLTVESFFGFEEIIKSKFSIDKKEDSQIIQTDKLHQINSYFNLWNHIETTDCFNNSRDAKAFVQNLGESNLNIIMNKSDDTSKGIGYFIDVNLKGKKLDTEDIFKGYLFRNDSGDEIRQKWYELKTNVSEIEENMKIKYPLLKLLEHFFFCDLYNNPKFKGLVFDENFLLKNEFKTHEDYPINFRARTHLIEVIDSNSYMLNSLATLNKVIKIMINIVKCNSTNSDFNNLFKYTKDDGSKATLDSIELEIIHNFMKKILRDEKILPKALVMKYIITVLLDSKPKKKLEYKQIYGVYLLAVLFVIFENNKSKGVFMTVLQASDDKWYIETVKQINSYFSSDKITNNKIISQFRQGANEDEEDYKFRCKSLATVYNFFRVEEDKIIISGKLDKIRRFVTDDDSFSTEHFIISESQQMKIKFNDHIKEYSHTNEVLNKYKNNLFNFIFIKKKTNTDLKNYWLPQKIQLIKVDDIECEYSKMVINKLDSIRKIMGKDVDEENYKDKLDLFFARDFKDLYIEYARKVLDSVIIKIKD